MFWKGQQEFRHDLFKLNVALMKKNVSYKKYAPQIEEVEHSHFFHSADMKGKPMTKSSSVGGHYHKVEVEIGTDDNGMFIKRAICSPPYRMVQKKLKNGTTRTIEEPVFYETEEDPETEEPGRMYDKHTHDIDFKGSEMISPERRRQQRSQDIAKLQELSKSEPKTGKPGVTPDQATGGETGEGAEGTVKLPGGGQMQEGDGDET